MEDNKDTQVETVEQETTQKTYTEQELQQKVNESFNAGVKKASTNWQKNEEYKEFLNWKKTNQSDSDKINELQTNNDSLNKEITYLKAQIQVSNSDVKKEFSKFVTSEVMSKVDDSTSFEEALKSFKKDNPQYFGETIVKKVQSSPNLNGGISQPQTTNSIMNDLIRGSKK